MKKLLVFLGLTSFAIFSNSRICFANENSVESEKLNPMRCCREYAYQENDCGEWIVAAATSCTYSETISMSELCLTAYIAAYNSIETECDKSPYL